MDSTITATLVPTTFCRTLHRIRSVSRKLRRAASIPCNMEPENYPVMHYSDARCQIITPRTVSSQHQKYVNCIINTGAPLTLMSRDIYKRHFSHLNSQSHQPFTLKGVGDFSGDHVFADLTIKGLNGKENIKLFGRVWLVDFVRHVVVANDILVPAKAKIEFGVGVSGAGGYRHTLTVNGAMCLLGFQMGTPYTLCPTAKKLLDLDG